MFFAFEVITIVLRPIRPLFSTSAVLLVIVPLPLICYFLIKDFKLAETFSFTIKPFAFVYCAIRFYHSTVTVRLVMGEFSFVDCTIFKMLFDASTFLLPVCIPFSSILNFLFSKCYFSLICASWRCQ